MNTASIAVWLKDHPIALAAGARGRDLWLWAMLYSNDHETDGELAEICVLSTPWGAGTPRGNRKLAEKLTELGAFVVTVGGWRLVEIERKSTTPASSSEDTEEKRREANRVRMRDARAAKKNPSARVHIERAQACAQTSHACTHGACTETAHVHALCMHTSRARSLSLISSSSFSADLLIPEVDPCACAPPRAHESATRVHVHAARKTPIDDETLTNARRALCARVSERSGEQLDVDWEWNRFVLRQRSQAATSAHWDADWERWLDDAALFAKRRRNGVRNAPAPVQVDLSPPVYDQRITPEQSAAAFDEELAALKKGKVA